MTFIYDLPRDRIAQRPVVPYHQAKLLVVNRHLGTVSDSVFKDLPALLSPGDLLVFNDTKVIKARLYGLLEGAGCSVEVLLVSTKDKETNRWIALGRPLKRFKKGSHIILKGAVICIEERVSDKEVLLSFVDQSFDETLEYLNRHGHMPIPPYIREGKSDENDDSDYQPMFASYVGSVAAPTASLHFTPVLVDAVKQAGAEIAFLTLHLGPASFLPIGENDSPGAEHYKYDSSLLERTSRAERVIAVGTSVTRALESMIRVARAKDGEILETRLFITPGFKFEITDSLITNFHQPHTTHLKLVEAFLGEELITASYSYGLEHMYRFLSYGDGMIII